MSCNKVRFKVECLQCGYPRSEARYPDREPPLKCESTDNQLRAHIERENYRKRVRHGNNTMGSNGAGG
jgi:hypothetical protein